VHDTLNRLQTLTPPSAFTTGSFGFSYDTLGRRTQMTRPNGVASNYSYDNLSHLLSVLHQLSGSTIDGATYTVDNAGNRTAKTDQHAGVTSNYAYDAIYELTGVTQGTNTTESYSYDPVGNRLSSLGVSSYTNNVSNELTAKTGVTYTYDNNGNRLTSVTGSNTTSYAWDYENRLSSVTLPGTGGTVSFKYDPFGRRIYKSSTAATSVYAYDLFSLIEETNVSGGVVARYTHGLKIDEPLAMLRSSTTSYYHADGLGSISSLSNAAGALAQTYTYDSFGQQTAFSGSLTNLFQYTGRELDAETGLYFYRARYYDPRSGIFLSEDPLQHDGGINFYPYVLNDPLNLTDSFGKQSNSVDSTLNQAIARGDSAEIEEILEDAKDVLSDKSKQLGRDAIKKLRTKAQDYIGQKCKGSVNQEFPSQLKDKTLEEIRNLSRGKGDLADAAKKAWKLLNDGRFQK
jgi:RHS repeat-associated protein